MEFFVIGEPEVVIGFRFAGIGGRPAVTPDEAREAFKAALSSGVTVLALTGDVAAMLEDEMVEHQMSGEFPLLVDLPPLEGRPEGGKTLIDSIREAIGLHV